MSDVNKYVIKTTMPSKFKWYKIDWGTHDVDLYNNPEGSNEIELIQGLLSFYGKSRWESSTYYADLPIIEDLIYRYGYTVEHEYEWYIGEDNMVVLFTLYTDALGLHLEKILDQVYSEYGRGQEGCGEWIKEARIKCHGWQDFNPAAILPTCLHTEKQRLQIMNDKDGSIVEVLECTKCKELSKRVIE